VEKENKHIRLLEKYAVIVLAYLFKAIRYFFRLLYKIVRLIYRLMKKVTLMIYSKLSPHYHKVLEKIYIRACKTFDVN
jgi:hypothetical protein